MPSRREHNKKCESKGISPEVCNTTNEWMDAPAKAGGGCTHREKRHSPIDCVKWALSGNPKEAIGRYNACQVHRQADKETDRCGSESLQE
jgi:hypothetical protein